MSEKSSNFAHRNNKHILTNQKQSVMAKRKNRSVKAIVGNKDFLTSLLSGAIYGSPWFSGGVHQDTPKEIYQAARDCNECAEDIWADVLLQGGFVLIEDFEDGVDYKISLKDVEKGFRRFMVDDPRHYADIMLEEADFYGYDALLQTIVFGEVQYA